MRRYDRELSLEIDRTVKRFNAKIKRLERAERNLLLPDPIERSDIITERRSKRDIEKRLKSYQQFLERDATKIIETESGLELTKYEYNKINRERTIAKRNLTREINKLRDLPVRIAGKEQAGTFSSMGDIYYTGLVDKRKGLDRDIQTLDKGDYLRYKQRVEKLYFKGDRDLVLKENWIDMLKKNGYFFGFDKRELDNIINEIEKLTPKQFYDLYKKDKAFENMFEKYTLYVDLSKSKSKNNVKNLDALSNEAHDLFDKLSANIKDITAPYAT